MALHLSEGAIHTVQTPSSYLGYRALRGMDKKRQLKPMPKEAIVYTGHYIDHELVSNIEADCKARREQRLTVKAEALAHVGRRCRCSEGDICGRHKKASARYKGGKRRCCS